MIKTPAIVLHLTNCNDNSAVLHLYTRSHGRVQYMIYGMGGRKSNAKKAVFEPLTVLDIDAQHKYTRQVQQLKDWTITYSPKAIREDMNRRCVALFISEILFRTLTHPLTDERMFNFLQLTIQHLDTCSDPENAHLRFLVEYADMLGFGIDFESPDNKIFDSVGYLNINNSLNQEQRRTLLHALINYYENHVPDFQAPNSLQILEEIFT